MLVGAKRDTLIVGNRNGVLAALDPATGEIRWRMFFWGSAVESEAVPGEASLFYIGSSDLRLSIRWIVVLPLPETLPPVGACCRVCCCTVAEPYR